MKRIEVDNTDKRIFLSDVMNLLSNETMYNKSQLHSSEIGDNGELRRISIKETSFETGFMCARKIILDAVNNNS